MSKYILITIGTEGDVRPFLSLGHALKQREHDVVLLTHCQYKNHAVNLGLEFEALDDIKEYENFIQDSNLINNPQGFITFFKKHVLPKFENNFHLLSKYCKEEDTVIITRFLSYFCSQSVSEKLKIPLVSVFTAPNEVSTLQLLSHVIQNTVGNEINQARLSMDLSPVNNWSNWFRYPGLTLGIWPEWYAPVHQNWPDVIPAGFLNAKNEVYNKIPEDAEKIINCGDRPVLITGGTGLFVGNDYFTACTEACDNLDQKAFLVAKHLNINSDDISSNVKIFKYLPFSEILPKMKAIIHHGGIGTVTQAVSAGIPQLILPIGADRPDNGERIQRLGIGDSLPPNRWNTKNIQIALQNLIENPEVMERCKELSDKLKNESGFIDNACEKLEKFASAKIIHNINLDEDYENIQKSGADENKLNTQLSPEKKALLAALLRKKQNNTNEKDLNEKNAEKVSTINKKLSPERQAYLALLLRKKQEKLKKEKPKMFSLKMDIKNRHEPFPLTDVQQAYWIGRNTAFELGGVATHGYMEFDCEGVDLSRLNRAWQLLIERHEMLHAVILPTGMQQILKVVPEYKIEVLDLEGKDKKIIDEELEKIRNHLSHQVLKVENWPPFEIRATRFDNSKIRLHVSFDVLFTDGWSVWIFLNELNQLYNDHDVALPDLELSFRDYVIAEKEFQNSEVYKKSLEYWCKRLPDFPNAPELPVINNSNSMVKPRFVRRTAKIEAKYWQKVKKLAESAGLTPTIVVLTAFAEILSAWSKNPKFTINLTLFNRMPFHPQSKNIIGDFTSLTLLAVDLAKQESFIERSKNIRDQLWNDLDHRYVSGIRVLREFARVHGGTTQALMPVVFTSTMNLPANLGGSLLEWLGTYNYGISQTPQVWLDNQVTEDDGMLVFNWDAVEDIFPEGLLDDMFKAYQDLLIKLSDGEEEWNKILPSYIPEIQLAQRNEINNTKVPISNEMLHTLFDKQVKKRPDETAVISSAKTLSYKELASYSRRIGRWLQKKGAEPNRLIAVVMEKGWEQAVAVYGILYSGAAYLPIDPSLPKERLWYLLEESKVKIALTQSKFIGKLDFPENILLVDVDNNEEWQNFSDEQMDFVQKPSDLAYVIYTSGSTGMPKGVMIDHRGAVNTILDVNSRFNVASDDCVLALSALNFDLSVYDIFGLLAAGGKVVIPDPGTNRDPSAWLKYIDKYGITLWNTVPTLMEMLIEYSENISRKDLSKLRVIMMSGDWIPVTLPDRIFSFSSDMKIFSLGGATEASIWSIYYPIEKVDPNWQSIPYGKPMLNQAFHVLDQNLEPCPVWVPGELYIGGIGVALGYLNDEKKTKHSFIIHPKTKERLYRTGDLGRYILNGNIEFLGREDFQVKIRGHRIELGEIETALLQHPDIRSAVVNIAGDKKGKNRGVSRNLQLVVYIVLEHKSVKNDDDRSDLTDKEKEKLEIDKFRSFLQSKVPEYMVPNLFVFLDELPLSANGKVNRKALPEPVIKKIKKISKPLSSPLEHTLADLWREILEVDSFSADDSFFDLGGDSIQVVQMHGKLQEKVEKEIPISKLFEYPTINSLASFIAEDGQGKKDALDQVGKAAQNRKKLMQRQQMRRRRN